MADPRTLIEGLGDMVAVLSSADPQKRAELFEALGLRLTWHPDDKKVLVEAQPARVLISGVGGGTCTLTPPTPAEGFFLAA